MTLYWTGAAWEEETLPTCHLCEDPIWAHAEGPLCIIHELLAAVHSEADDWRGGETARQAHIARIQAEGVTA